MKPFSKRLNNFVLNWFEENKDYFEVFSEPQFNLDDADETFIRFKEHWLKTGKIPMWYDDNYDNTFGNREVNAKFRAWHDYMHVITDNDFSLLGEIKTFNKQKRLLPKDWEYERLILRAEIVGQAEHYSKSKEPIKSQREFATNYIKNLKK